MSAVPAWKSGAGRVLASARRQEREGIAADVEALAEPDEATVGTICGACGHTICRDCVRAIAAMIRAGGKKRDT